MTFIATYLTRKRIRRMPLSQLERQKCVNVLNYWKDMPIKPYQQEDVHKLSYELEHTYTYNCGIHIIFEVMLL